MNRTATVRSAPPDRRHVGNLLRDALVIAGAVLMAATLYLIFLWVPTDANLGVSQRAFYFHVPVAILSLISILVIAGASVTHLITKGKRSDATAYAAAEIGFVFCSIGIVTGAIWAKPVWGVWWTWDPKLTLTLALWFIYASYLMLRAYGPKGSQGARYGAVLAIIGAVDAPIIYYAAELWRSTHPSLVLGPSAEADALDPRMLVGVVVSMVAFAILFAHLIIERYSLRHAENDIDEIFQRVT